MFCRISVVYEQDMKEGELGNKQGRRKDPKAASCVSLLAAEGLKP